MTSSVALEHLYARRADELLAFFLRRTADPQIAADLWAETFAQTVAGHRLRKPLTGDPEHDAALLFAIAQRQLARYYRRGYAERRALDRLGLERPELGPDPALVLEGAVSLAELRASVREAVDQIPNSLSLAVQLRVVEQQPYPEVAARLQITEEAARARVSRGLRALAHLLPQTPSSGASAASASEQS